MDEIKLEFSVIIPVYNSEESLIELHKSLSATLCKTEMNYEIIFVNDASRDNSWEILKEIKRNDVNVIIISLMKNFGQHNALLCGFHHCSGKYVITMDDDLQYEPENIIKLYRKIKEGYDAVIASYSGKKRHGAFRNCGSRFINRINSIIFNKPKEIKLSSFKIIRKYIVDRIIAGKTNNPYISGLIFNITNKIVNVEVPHKERKYGKSNYNVGKLFKLTSNLLFNYSDLPLKFISSIGLIASLSGFFIGSFFLIRKLFVGTEIVGWTSLFVVICFFFSLQFLFLTIIGEYLGRIIMDKYHSNFEIAEIIK